MEDFFWRGKRVFITGHTGFKGSWLSLWLTQLGAQISGYSLAPNTTTNLFDLLHLKNDLQNNIADIRDLDLLKSSISKFQPDIVIHMAAQPLVRYSYKNPIETYSTNVMGTANLLEAVRYCDSVRVLVNVTTDKCYQNNNWPWGYRENDRLGGHDPYSNSKACSELVTESYRHSFFSEKNLGIATARAGNVIGGGDWACDRLIPDFIHAITNLQTIQIRHPSAQRPWQYVLEPLLGYMTLIKELWKNPTEYSGSWNFGPKESDCKTVGWIVDKLIELWGVNILCEKNHDNEVYEAKILKLDISKSCSYLKWQPRWNLELALSHLVEWYKHWQQDSQTIRSLCLSQISAFENTKI